MLYVPGQGLSHVCIFWGTLQGTASPTPPLNGHSKVAVVFVDIMGPLALANTTIADSRTFGAHMPYKLALPSKGIYLAIFFSIHAYLDKKLHILILPSSFNITDVCCAKKRVGHACICSRMDTG